jgi:eukaryotic-like serine/threonine-protein kinase
VSEGHGRGISDSSRAVANAATLSPDDRLPDTLHAGSSPSQRQMAAYIGTTLEGRYVIEQLLGEGGMGYVYLGRHKLIDKRVAIKILRRDFAEDKEMTERFLNEARAASSIGHPHIVDISDFGKLTDGCAFFVMEFLDGRSLAEVMRATRVVPIARLLHIAKQIARGLAAAHARGIVHRDLKPDNVMLIERGEDRDFVKVLDFGIAKVATENTRLTRAGSVFGTPHYMSPEQAAGVPVDVRTDIYALGVILYEMAAGKVPFDADNFMGILTQHMYKAPAPIRAVVPQPQEVPPGLEAVVLKTLSKKVELRYQTMEELIGDLEKVERGLVPDAVPEMMSRSGGFNVPADYFRQAHRSAPQMWANPAPRRRGVLLGVIVGIFLLAGIIGVVLISSAAGRQVRADTFDAAPAPPPVSAPAPAADPPQLAPAKVSVVVTTEPIDATIAIDNKTDAAQPQPRSFLLGHDERITLRVERSGYRTIHYVVDAKKIDPASGRIALRLEPLRDPPKPISKPVAPPAPPKSTPTPSAAPPPVSTVRPAWCPLEDWDMFKYTCRRAPPH